jgi:hypothetical protein
MALGRPAHLLRHGMIWPKSVAATLQKRRIKRDEAFRVSRPLAWLYPEPVVAVQAIIAKDQLTQ